MSYRYCIV
jgi:hypothetical protein